ncbi:Transcription initiation TFIID 10 [Spraguea lophii 42_110]|uniref:Transcription initiation TFIID 10 n=1 Tax=Spraguea lophii (strain 42_110) TaxID=1358809 RepID=S7WAJ6_SPRLO|nr:Transcription initiation TFIID 10 [Spraguea lophii 42_110]
MADNNEIEKIKEEIPKFSHLIPEEVIDYFLEKAGVDTADPDVKKTIALLGQKFLTDVAESSFQFHKLNQKATQKDKRFAKEKRPTLQMVDLEKALEEQGIDISRPHIYM